MKRLLFVVFFIISNLPVEAQVAGYVVDADTKENIKGAYVFIENGKFSVTNGLGYFKIENPSGDSLHFRHIGYKNKSVAFQGHSLLNVLLSPNYNDLEEVRVVAWAGSVSLGKASGNISLIDRSDFENENQQSIAASFEKIPGITIHQGAFNTSRIVFRGIGSRSQYATYGLKAYLNGIPITTGDGILALEDIDPGFLERAEIMKGPASSVYGSALGGVIRLQSKSVDHEGFGVETKHVISSFNTFDNSLLISHGGKKGDVLLGFSSNISDGFRENSGFQRESFVLTYNHRIKKLSLNFMSLVLDMKAFIPSSLNKSTFDNNPERAAQNWGNVKGYEDVTKWTGGLGAEYPISKNLKLNTVFFLSPSKNVERRPVPLHTLSGDYISVGNRTSLSLVMDRLYFTLGFERMNENADKSIHQTIENGSGDLLAGSVELKKYTNLYISNRYQLLDWLGVTSSFNITMAAYHMDSVFYGDSVANPLKIEFPFSYSPRLGLNVKWKNHGQWYTSVSHGFSPPSFEESLNTEAVFNANIKPSYGWMFETGLRGRVFRKMLYHDLTFYSMDIKDLLVVKRISEDVFYNDNAGSGIHRGMEAYFSFDYPLASNEKKPSLNIDMALNYSLNRFNIFVDDGIDYSGNELPGIPQKTFYTGTKMNYQGFSLRVKYQWVDKMYLNDDNTLFSGSYKILSTSINQKLVLKKTEFNLMAGINNLLNEHYASMLLVNAMAFGNNAPRYYYPGLPRNFYIGFKLLF